MTAYFDARRGEHAALEAVELAQSNDLSGARVRLADARDAFEGAEYKLSSVAVFPARTIPLVGRQFRTAHAMAKAGALSARAGLEAAKALDAKPAAGWISGGRVDLSAVGRAAQSMRAAAPLAAEADVTIEATSGSFLFPPLAGARGRALDVVGSAASSIRKANAGLDALPTLLGADRPKRYLVVFSNLAELRGTGGLWGFHAFLTADNGRLSIGEPGRPRDDLPPLEGNTGPVPEWFQRAWERHGSMSNWLNINMSPDFPIVGSMASHATGADGVIQIDAFGIASLLRLTGPISMQTWPEPIHADNVVPVASHDVYARYTEEPLRDAFGAELLMNVFGRALGSGLPLDTKAFTELEKAVRGGHFQMYSRDSQDAITTLEMDGGLARTKGATDILGVHALNADASKQDYFLRREISYKVFIDPDKNIAESEVTVTLKDEMPATGEPDYVLGGNVDDIPPSINRTMLLLTRPAGTKLTEVTVNGEPVQATSDSGDGSRTNELLFDVRNGGRTTVRARYLDELRFKEHAYQLRLLKQATIGTNRFRLEVQASPGWHVNQAPRDDTSADLQNPSVRLAKTFWSRIGDSLVGLIEAVI